MSKQNDRADPAVSTSLAARIRPQHTVDIVFAVALSALAISGWSSTFAGPGWWIAATVAAVLGIAIAVAISDAGGGVQWVLLALIVLYLLAVGPLAVGRVELIGLSSFEEGMTQSGSSWITLLRTHPPVDAQGAVLLPPVLLSLFGPALAVSLSVRSRRMLAPIVPPSLVFVGVILMGQHTTTSVVGQGLAFAGLAVLWMRVRALRDEESGTGHDPARLRRIGASVALIVAASLTVVAVAGPQQGLAAGPTSGTSNQELSPPIPDPELDRPPGAERFLLRDRAAPFDAERLSTPLDRFRDFTSQRGGSTDNLFEERLLRVEGAPEGTRIRFAALDTYDGQRWKADNRTDPLRLDDRFLAISSTTDNPAEGERAEISVTLSGKWNLPWIPTIGALQGFEFDRSANSDAASVRYNPATATAVMDGKPATRDGYRFTTLIAEADLERSEPAAPYFDQVLFDEAEFLDVATSIGRLGSKSRIDALFAIAADLRRNGRYSDGAGLESQVTAGQSRKRLGEDFINAFPTVGNDEQYAAAFALIANRLRIPARVVIGAVVPGNGVVRGRDVQAWVEVRVADGTWRTVPTQTFMSRKPLSAPEGSLQVVPRDFPEPTEPKPDQEADRPDAETDDPEADADDSSSRASLLWPALFGIVLLLLALTPALLKLRRGRRRRRARTGAGRYAGAWAELVDQARDLGHDVPNGTRPAQARVLTPVLTQASVLALEADRRAFAATDPDPAESVAFWRLVDDELAGLRGGVSPLRRIWAHIRPRSLR